MSETEAVVVSKSILTKAHLATLFDNIPTNPLIVIDGQDYEEIEQGAFETFKELRMIKITKCKLKSLDKNCFMNRENADTTVWDFETINFIDLSDNQLSRIEPDTFSFTKKLTELNLSGNLIEKLSKKSFQCLKSLVKLSLHDNKLTSLDADIFKSLTRVKTIDLSNNKLRNIPEFAFKDLLNLSTLDLSNNCIREINTNAFVNLPNLAKIKLRYNYLEVIKDATFKSLNTNKTVNTEINLSFNNIRWLDAALFEKLTPGSSIICQAANNRSILDFRSVYNDVFEKADGEKAQLKLKKSTECSSLFMLLIQSNANIKDTIEKLERQRVFDILIQNRNISPFFLMNVIELYSIDKSLYKIESVTEQEDFKLENESFKILCKHGNEQLLQFFLKRNDFQNLRPEYSSVDLLSVALANDYEAIALALLRTFEVNTSRNSRGDCMRVLKVFFELDYNEVRYKLNDYVNDEDSYNYSLYK
jgi:Leucine-rich repeat (LRR) protein